MKNYNNNDNDNRNMGPSEEQGFEVNETLNTATPMISFRFVFRFHRTSETSDTFELTSLLLNCSTRMLPQRKHSCRISFRFRMLFGFSIN